MRNDSTVYVGLDVHKDSIVAAYAVDLGEIQDLGNVGVLQRDLDRLCRRMRSKASQVRFVYEAGPLRVRGVPLSHRQGLCVYGVRALADGTSTRGSGQDRSTRRTEAGQGVAHERSVGSVRARCER